LTAIEKNLDTGKSQEEDAGVGAEKMGSFLLKKDGYNPCRLD